jgi:CRISPR-associated protein Cas2
MIVIILENATPSARGTLTKWLIEPHPGVYVGHVNAMVRDKLWEKLCKSGKVGGIIQMWSTNNEQRFEVRMHGQPSREIVDLEGLKLIRRP